MDGPPIVVTPIVGGEAEAIIEVIGVEVDVIDIEARIIDHRSKDQIQNQKSQRERGTRQIRADVRIDFGVFDAVIKSAEF